MQEMVPERGTQYNVCSSVGGVIGIQSSYLWLLMSFQGAKVDILLQSKFSKVS